MPDSTLETIKAANADLIRKILDLAIVVAPYSAAVPTSFTSGASSTLQSLATDYKPIGWTDKDDGATWSRDLDVSETTSHGSSEPTRRDVNSDVTGFQMTAQQTSKLVLELTQNIDLTGVTPTATTGEIGWNKPVAPATRYYRLIAIGRDGAGTDTIYVIKVLPRAMISDIGDETWSDTDALTYPLTWTATPDPTLGYAVRTVLAGPGVKSRLVSMGFPAAT